MQTVMQLESLILYYNKDLFSHNDMGEVTSLSLVGVHVFSYQIYDNSEHPMHSDLPNLYHLLFNARHAVNSNSLAFSFVR